MPDRDETGSPEAKPSFAEDSGAYTNPGESRTNPGIVPVENEGTNPGTNPGIVPDPFASTDELKTAVRNVEPVDSGRGAQRLPTLVVLSGERTGHQVILSEEPLSIGRSRRCGLAIDDDGISRSHALVEYQPALGHSLRDLDSTNGTYINGRRLPPNEPVPLSVGDRLQVGTHTLLRFSMQEEIETEAQSHLLEATRRDPLTGCYNRGYLDMRLEELIEEMGGRNQPLSFMLIDLDHFKRVNDTYGHAAGDYVLKRLVTILTQQLYDEDVLARYGGEEFGIVLPEVGIATAALKANRVRKSVAETAFVYDSQTIPVTLSVGVSCSDSHEKLSPKEMLEAADRRLYAAKNFGRNQVVSDDCGIEEASDARSADTLEMEGEVGEDESLD